MIEDRHYMRSSLLPAKRSAAVVLIVVNIVVFVLQEIFDLSTFALSLQGLARLQVWQLFSFQFLHDGLLHLVCNLLVIYFFGRSVEESIGRNRFLTLYFSSGVIGGLLQMAFALALPSYFGGAVVGASAGGFGLVAAFAAMFPERQLTMLLFFVIPVSMRAKTLLWVSIGIALFGMLIPIRIAHAAHLGGILTGLGYVFWVVQGNRWPFSAVTFRPPSRRPRELVSAGLPKRAFWQRPKSSEPDDLPPAEFISREVDPILDKISAHGIQSLTDRERKILEAARAKMAKR